MDIVSITIDIDEIYNTGIRNAIENYFAMISKSKDYIFAFKNAYIFLEKPRLYTDKLVTSFTLHSRVQGRALPSTPTLYGIALCRVHTLHPIDSLQYKITQQHFYDYFDNHNLASKMANINNEVLDFYDNLYQFLKNHPDNFDTLYKVLKAFDNRALYIITGIYIPVPN